MGFFADYLRKPRLIGAVAPSSRFLCERMLKPIDFSNSRTIVELGAGTGAFTRIILKRMRKDARLVVFEIHKPFVKKLKTIKDTRLKVISKPAQHLSSHVANADAIVSGLPLMAFPEQAVKKIISEAKAALKPNGVFVQFQYALKSRKFLKQNFSRVMIDFTPLNIPPAFVYVCRK
ncbi:MAG: methyltransferase domain-containing protein [Candidatus Woesearchaeota archaeon]